MKKGIFLPMLAIFVILIIGVLSYTFYKNEIKSKNEYIGEKSGFVIKTIIDNEKNYFFIQDSARLAYCDSMENLSNIGVGCLSDNYPLLSFSFNDYKCNPENTLDESFKKYFNENFLRYIHTRKEFENFKYKVNLLDDGFSLSSDPIIIENTDPNSLINIKYPFKVDMQEKIKSNVKQYKSLVSDARNYKNCITAGKTIDLCNVETKLRGSRSDNLIKFEISSIKNPCILRDINIKFALEAPSGVA